MKQNKTVELDGEIVHLAKSDNIWGWRVVHPIQDDNGLVNWMNLLFGGKGNLITLLFIIFIIAAMIYGVSEMTSSCREMAANPCEYFKVSTCYSNMSRIVDTQLLIIPDEIPKL